MSMTIAQKIAHAAELIRSAEAHLGELTPGQRRDYVADRTDWDRTSINEAVAAYRRYRYTPDTCPSKHWNDGTDFCADCGEDLNP